MMANNVVNVMMEWSCETWDGNNFHNGSQHTGYIDPTGYTYIWSIRSIVLAN